MQHATPMDFDDLRCPKCNSPMTRGYSVDIGSGTTAGMDHVERWVPGRAVKSVLAILRPRNALSVATFRCESCGYLESYARPEFESKRQFSLRYMLIVFTIIAITIGIVAAIYHARS
jgi:hypothetical protein